LTTLLPDASYSISSTIISIPPDRKWTWRKKNLPAFGNAAILCRQFILICISCCSIRANTTAAPIQNAAIIFSSADAVQTNATAAIAVLPKWVSKAKHIDRIRRNRQQIQKQKNIRNCAEEIVLIGLVYT